MLFIYLWAYHYYCPSNYYSFDDLVCLIELNSGGFSKPLYFDDTHSWQWNTIHTLYVWISIRTKRSHLTNRPTNDNSTQTHAPRVWVCGSVSVYLNIIVNTSADEFKNSL